MQRVWNRLYPKESIRVAGKRGKTRKANAETSLWRALRKMMRHRFKCATEFCVIEKMPGLSQDERQNLKGYFRPQKPDAWNKKPTTWLDSFNIEDVMEQYEAAYPTFEFIGPVPIDFDAPDGEWGRCIVDELCKLELSKMSAAGTQQIGIIFNLDKHNEPGSHWVCAFIHIPRSSAYYFDSYGYEPPEEIVTLFNRLRKQGIQHTYYNDVRHQRKGSECGMYCLYTIISLVLGKRFYDICVNIVDDDTMNALRDVLFASESPRIQAIERALKLIAPTA